MADRPIKRATVADKMDCRLSDGQCGASRPNRQRCLFFIPRGDDCANHDLGICRSGLLLCNMSHKGKCASSYQEGCSFFVDDGAGNCSHLRDTDCTSPAALDNEQTNEILRGNQ